MSLAIVTKNSSHHYMVSYKSSRVVMHSYEDELYLSCFGSGEREQGHGTEVLNLCRRIARRLKRPLRLTAAPYTYMGIKPYDIDRLKAYYQKRGFSVTEDLGRCCLMEYNPH